MGRKAKVLRINTVRIEKGGANFSLEVLSSLNQHKFKRTGSFGSIVKRNIELAERVILGLLGTFEESSVNENEPIVLDQIYSIEGSAGAYLIIIKLRKVEKRSYDIRTGDALLEGPEALIVLTRFNKGKPDAGVDYYLLVNKEDKHVPAFVRVWNFTIDGIRKRSIRERDSLFAEAAVFGAEQLDSAQKIPLRGIRSPLELALKIIMK